MCGFVGMFDLDAAAPLDPAPVRRGMALMQDRGPDAEGLYQGPGVVLGHRRLAVIDPDGARQPWIDAATGAVLVYNGELYNFRELRRELGAGGRPFVSRSDTEVLLQAWLAWGPACLARLRGMYAFVIWDPTRQTLFLARDRVGVKPLYYARRGRRWLVASTLPALRCLPGIEPVLDLDTASHYLTTVRTTLGERTLYREVRTLLPGTSLALNRAAVHVPRPQRYWDFPIVPATEKRVADPAQVQEEVRALVGEAVHEQLVSDVPLGGFLSGGVDSAVIASLASRASPGGFLAYHTSYAGDGFDEWPAVQEIVQACGISCCRLQPDTAAYPADWDALMRRKGLPLSTPNEVPIWHLAKAVKARFTVALTGEGSDELFGGYVVPYFSAWDYDRARRQPPAVGEPPTPLDNALEQLYGRPWSACWPDHHFLLNSWVSPSRKPDLLTPDAWLSLRGDDAMFTHYEALFAPLAACSTLDAFMHVHARVNLEGLLARVDSSTMAASVEARVPFTDHRLAERLFQLPDHLKLDWCDEAARQRGQELNAAQAQARGLVRSKILLRDAFCGLIPDSVRRRPKMSFPVPFETSFAGPWRGMAAAELEASPLRGTLLAAATLDNLVRHADHRANAMLLWPVVNLCLWVRLCQVQLS